FAGTDAAFSAARLRGLQDVSSKELEITVVSPEPFLTIRPRLYEPNPETMAAPLLDVFAAVDVRFIQGKTTAIDTARQTVTVQDASGAVRRVEYDRLVIATGSELFRPPIPGLAEHAYSVNTMSDAIALSDHLKSLAQRSDSPARNTVVVGGGGFTGIEVG